MENGASKQAEVTRDTGAWRLTVTGKVLQVAGCFYVKTTNTVC